jgi:hypothetical protein
MAASENDTKVWLDVLAEHTALQEQYVGANTSPAEVRHLKQLRDGSAISCVGVSPGGGGVQPWCIHAPYV